MKCCECPNEVPAIGHLSIKDNSVACSEDCVTIHIRRMFGVPAVLLSMPSIKVEYVEEIRMEDIV